MDRIVPIARRHHVRIIEDAAQAHGATWRGRRAGSLGDVACFSFYPAKNLGAYGDGGAVVSPDESLIERIRMLADHGRSEKYTHMIQGVNSRLDALQAAILRVKLRHLDDWVAARRRHAAWYTTTLATSGLTLPVTHPAGDPAWHLYVVRSPRRERVQTVLAKAGVGTGIHYPIPVHRQPAYQALNLPFGTFPVAERAANEILSLPMFAELTQGQLYLVADAAREASAPALPTARAAA
jgi:dTDP-4-amino-4,6-dideoxygalactose transaminase